MHLIHSASDTYTLNFEPGERVMAGLAAFCKERDIKAAHVSGLGAAREVEVAYYNLETKEYERRAFREDVEIVSLVGNVGIKEGGELVVHVHGAFGRRDYSLFGGHVFELVISGAGEVHLHALPGVINRAYNAATGLTLMCREV